MHKVWNTWSYIRILQDSPSIKYTRWYFDIIREAEQQATFGACCIFKTFFYDMLPCSYWWLCDS